MLPECCRSFWVYVVYSLVGQLVLPRGTGTFSELLAARNSPVSFTVVMSLISDPGPIHRLLQKGVCGARAAHQ